MCRNVKFSIIINKLIKRMKRKEYLLTKTNILPCTVYVSNVLSYCSNMSLMLMNG
jgi:hypothetical protein